MLAARLMATPPEPLVFQQTVEGLLRALGPDLTTRAAPRLREAGLEVGMLLPAYPLPAWVRMLEVAAEALSPGAPQEQAMFALGQRFFAGFGTTLVERALLGVIRVLGPRRTLERLTRNFRTANNYTQAQLETLGPTACRVWLSQVTHAEWYRGLLQAALEASGAQRVEVVLEGREAGGATFQLRWA